MGDTWDSSQQVSSSAAAASRFASVGSPHDGRVSFGVTAGGMYYVATTPDVRIEFFDFVSRKSTVVARHLGEGAEVGGMTASADARTLLYARRQAAVDDLMLVERFR